MKIRGTLVNYYFICKRAMWFESRRINYTNDYMEIGKMVHEKSYRLRQREVVFAESVAFDIVRSGDKFEVYEIKKSSAALNAAKWQLKYYLYLLKKEGVNAVGYLLIPKEKKRLTINLTKEDCMKIEKILRQIIRIISSERPPKPKRGKYCEKCSYRDFCWV